jgi:hypothetical protein
MFLDLAMSRKRMTWENSTTISPKRRSTLIFLASTWTFHRIRHHWTNSVSVCAAGISGAKVEPDEESATNLKEKLWNNETFE